MNWKNFSVAGAYSVRRGLMGGEHGGGSRRKRWQPDCIGPFSKARFDFQSVQSLSRVQLFATPRTALQQVSLSITTSQSLLKLRSIVPVMPSNHLILSSPSPPAFNLSQHQGLFKWVSSSHQVAKVLEFQFQHQSFQMNIQDQFLLGWTGWISLQFKGLSRVFLQHHSSKASILQCSAFFNLYLMLPPLNTT